MGLFYGCFVALVGPTAFHLYGPLSASQAVGFLLGLYSTRTDDHKTFCSGCRKKSVFKGEFCLNT